MFLMENIQNASKNKYIIKIDSHLGLVEIYLGLVLGSEHSYQCNLNPTFISNFMAYFNSINPSVQMGFILPSSKYEKTHLVNRYTQAAQIT